jgi:sulfur-oxidizing protein SoxX
MWRLWLAGALSLVAVTALAQQQAVDPARVDAAIRASFPHVAPDWLTRFTQDETTRACSAYRNNPPADVAEKLRASAKAAIRYPADGKLSGDWKKGEQLAQSGYGLRFTDTQTDRPNGGNCYACHQLAAAEVSFGTIGPSLLGYGKIRKFAPAEVKATYDKIYNSHAVIPCSQMPRFGSNGVLTIEQIKDVVALLMDPASPVNK